MPQRIDTRLAEMPLSDLFAVSENVKVQPDRGAAIITVSFVEEHLRYAIDRKFVELSPRTSSRIFEGSGPLSTFYSRVLIGYALGLYDKTAKEELITLGQIRNHFAHTIKEIDFEAEAISKLCKQLRFPEIHRQYFPFASNNRSMFELSCWYCRSLIVSAAQKEEKPERQSDPTIIAALAEAKDIAERVGKSDALPHVHRQSAGQTLIDP